MKSFLAKATLGLLVAGVTACATLAGVGNDSVSSNSGTDTTTAEAGVDRPRDNVVDSKFIISQDPDKPLDFGKVICNQRSPAQVITISNTSTETKPYTLVLPGDPFLVEDDHQGSLPAGETAKLTVTAAPILAGTAAGSLVIQTKTSFVAITVTTEGTGAKLDWSPSAPDLGQVNKSAGGSMKVTLVNTGTIVANVTALSLASGSNHFSITPGSAAIAPNTPSDFTVTLASGNEETVSAIFTPAVTGVCGAVPSVTVKGQLVNSEVTIGTGDFGKKSCNTDPGQKDIAIQNYSPVAKTWTTDPLTKFQILNNTGTGSIDAQPVGNPGVSTSGKISVKAIAGIPDPGSYDENLVVHVKDAPGGTNEKVLTVALHIDVRGSKLTITPTDMQFNANVGQSQDKKLSIMNSGNEGITFRWDYDRTAGGAAWIVPSSANVNGGSTVMQTITYQPSGAPPNAATLNVNHVPFYGYAGGPFCNATPTVRLTGNTAP